MTWGRTRELGGFIEVEIDRTAIGPIGIEIEIPIGGERPGITRFPIDDPFRGLRQRIAVNQRRARRVHRIFQCAGRCAAAGGDSEIGIVDLGVVIAGAGAEQQGRNGFELRVRLEAVAFDFFSIDQDIGVSAAADRRQLGVSIRIIEAVDVPAQPIIQEAAFQPGFIRERSLCRGLRNHIRK